MILKRSFSTLIHRVDINIIRPFVSSGWFFFFFVKQAGISNLPRTQLVHIHLLSITVPSLDLQTVRSLAVLGKVSVRSTFI